MKLSYYWWTLLGLVYPAYKVVQDSLVEQIDLTSYDIRNIVLDYVLNECKPIYWKSRKYDGCTYVTKDGIETGIWMTVGDGGSYFLTPNKEPFFMWMERKHEITTVCIKYVKFLMNPDKFMLSAKNYFHENISSKKYRKRYYLEMVDCNTQNRIDGDTIYREEGKEISPIHIESRQKLRLQDFPASLDQLDAIHEMEKWISSKNWYKEKGISWKRGYLFYGPPGTGKTTLAVSLAKHFKIGLSLFDLSTFDNQTFLSKWRDVNNNLPPRIILFEDIDSVFNGRENITKTNMNQKNSLTWDCLLSALDGVNSQDGLILIVTTNRPEVLDTSLAKMVDGEMQIRRGRIDRAIEFGPLSRAGRIQVATKILGDRKRAAKLVWDMEDVKVADIQEICIQHALKNFWG